ncbi:ribosomal 40S subunit protein S13, variant 2 [Trifolium repens]|nr:ribosomal 40S subunit protein S13, variant 2 [Trifolium repens]
MGCKGREMSFSTYDTNDLPMIGDDDYRLAPEIPEDLYHLIKKVVSIRNHLERNIKDKDSKFRLILVDSRIHRLARYYKKTKKLPPVWKYESTTATNALVA